jgi:hypothetical protein
MTREGGAMVDGAIAELGGAAAVEIAASALAERGAKPGMCHNCGVSVIADYCAVCGQERDSHRRSLGALMHEVVREVASFDSRILRTAGALMVRPAELPLAFHEGRTRRYVPAVRLYLMVSLLFFATLSLTGIALMQIELLGNAIEYTVKALPDGDVQVITHGVAGDPIPRRDAEEAGGTLSAGTHWGPIARFHFFAPIGRFHQSLSPSTKARIEEVRASLSKFAGDDRNGWMARNALATLDKLTRDPAALNEPLTTWIPRILFLLLPAFAVLLAVFYIRQRKRFFFVDHLVFSLSMHSFVFAALIVAIGAAQIVPGSIVADVVLVAFAAYFLIALKRFYRQGWAITAVKFVAISFLYWVVFVVPALLVAVATGIVSG